MKLNRKWLLVIALVLSLTTAISGTLAYLTDRDTVENTFTMGGVDIEVEEDFPEGGAPIKPGETVDKEAEIKNTGSNPAWVWMTVSVPEGLKDYVTLNWTESYANKAMGPKVVDGQAVWTMLVNNQLAVNESTGYILKSVTLSELVDYQGGKYVVVKDGQSTDLEGIVDGKMKVTVNGYAVQTEGLNTVTEAYNAYNTQWGEEGAPIPFASVKTFGADDTLINDNVTVLDKNLTIDTTDSKMGLDVGVIPLDVAYQFEPTMSLAEAQNSEYRYWHADFVVTANKDIPAYGIGLAGYYNAWCSLNNDKWVMLASDQPIEAGTKIRLVEAMGGGSITVNYEELCEYGNDGIGFLCGAVALEGKIDGTDVSALEPGTTLTVELRLYETEEPSPENGNTRNKETGHYITTGVYTYTF
ncbi:MAG: SipW-dependent-type signal peptide-containing protein [Clostridia bacterium]|nr:SipW-dependent-type signal peptide-containing protein [Clostridia bacterium]